MVEQQNTVPTEEPQQFVERLLGGIHRLNFEQLLQELQMVELIQQQASWLPKSFTVVGRLLRRRCTRQQQLRKFQTALKVQQLQLKLLGRKLDMINAESTLRLMEQSQRTSDSTALVQMVDRIRDEKEYENACNIQRSLEHPKQKSYDELIKNIEDLPTSDQQIKPAKPPDQQTLNSELSDTSETEKVSVGGKVMAYLSERTGRLLETIAELAETAGLTSDS